MDIQFANNASGTLLASITATDLGITVQAGEGAEFPVLSGAQYFCATLVNAAGVEEIVKVTARTGDTMTIVRAQEGTAAVSFAAGSLVELRVTAGGIVVAVEEEVAELAATLATTAGAAVVGIADAGTYYTGVTVEAALQEVWAGKQGLDATLTALAGLDGSAGVVYQSGADAFFKRSIGTGVNTIAAGDHTHASVYQGLDATLTAVAGLSADAGVLYQTGVDAFSKKVIGTGAGEVAAGDHNHTGVYQGVDNTLTALAALDATAGVVYQTGADAFTKKTLTAPGDPPLFACRAWGNFNGIGTPTYRASGNMDASITDVGVGRWTVAFTIAMPDANYAVNVGGYQSALPDDGRAFHAKNLTAAGFTIHAVYSADGITEFDADYIYFAVFR